MLNLNDDISSVDEAYARAVDKIARFPGSQTEYERYVSYDVRIIDTGRPDMGVLLGEIFPATIGFKDPRDSTAREVVVPFKVSNRELGERLLGEGIEALIRFQQTSSGFYGLSLS